MVVVNRSYPVLGSSQSFGSLVKVRKSFRTLSIKIDKGCPITNLGQPFLIEFFYLYPSDVYLIDRRLDLLVHIQRQVIMSAGVLA